MIRCPGCGAEVQPDWDWCHACGFDPDASMPVPSASASPRPRPPTVDHPEVLRSELVPLDRSGADPTDPVGGARSETRARTTGSGARGAGGPGYVARPSRSGLVVAAFAAGAVLLVIVVALVLTRPAPVTTATIDRSAASFTTTTALAVTPWLLPEGGLTVDLPTTLAPSAPPSVPVPFVSATAYRGAADGRTYVVANFAVHPDYRWEDTGRAFIDAVDTVASEHGLTVVSRSAGAFEELPSSSFTVVESRRPDESDAAFQARKDGTATGEGIAVIDGNRLYLVIATSDSLARAQFRQIRDSITVSSVVTPDVPPVTVAPDAST